MKRTITMWAMFSPKNGLCLPRNKIVSMDNTRKELQMQTFSWPELFKRGYRCRKVKISWEE